ncbi:MAG: class I SAM-dependent methyltransferase [Rhodospirillales bacterium]
MIRNFAKKVLAAVVWSAEVLEAKMADSRHMLHHSRNLQNVLWERALADSADFVEPHLPDVLVFKTQRDIWDYTVQKIRDFRSAGTALEFGVAAGSPVNYMSERLPSFRFHGFDSFEGLAEDWKGHHSARGKYTQRGVMPKVSGNVTLIKGWFDKTVPEFTQKTDLTDLAFVHIDSDTYEAAAVVFNNIAPFLKPGVLVLFDELIGYPNWRNGEFKALHEAGEKFGFKFEYLAFSTQQALIRITEAR